MITLVGWSQNGKYDIWHPGQSDTKLRLALAGAKAIVTFNGTLFDLPFVRRFFSGIVIPDAHIDLRFLARRAGIGGPQKDVERKIDLIRDSDLEEVDGKHAVVLWHRYRRGDLDAFRQLVRYNHADIQGMKAIFDKIGRAHV